ncbi:hypothetical protein [Streptomyces auratus]|uniref:Uncharacterized protein n=1 Tax=Streptomyces auratus AGR0001 TaxID=1160718 RepID=A0A8B1NRA7_9ACTN|nr:hypothetical protein [Streptomyces auratus]QTZ93250.1 hypothetical protein SU9_018695 [Streptomyces auratus AGR0001]
MANQYPGPPPEQPPGQSGQSGQSGQNPYARPDDGAPAGSGYGFPQGGRPGEPGYGYPQTPSQQPPGYGYPQAASQQPPAPGFPPAAPPQPAPGGFQGGAQPGGMMLSLGDIAVSGDTVMTPAGPMPLKGAVWTATDMSRTEERMPTHAVVLAIVFFLFCLLGLLFLLMKERVTTGFVQVTVNSGGRHHSTMIPVQSREQVMFVLNQVNYARSLSV